MRNSWTDERLDDGFDRVTAEIALVRGEVALVRGEVASVREEVASVRGEVAALRTEMRAEFKAVRQEMHEGFAMLNRTLFQVGGGIIATLLGVLLTTQL